MKNAKWVVDFYLRDQDKGKFWYLNIYRISTGDLAGKPVSQREKEYSFLLEKLKKDAFYVAPPGGESLANSYVNFYNKNKKKRKKNEK